MDKRVTVELTATSNQFTAETGKATSATHGLANEVKNSGVSITSSMGQAGSSFGKATQQMGADTDMLKHKLEELREIGGRRSTIGELGELLKGAGAVAGISIIGEVLEKDTEKAAQLAKEFREGKVDAEGLAVGIGESLPVIGAFVTAGQNIREVLFNEKAIIEDINAEIKAGNEYMETEVKRAEGIRKALEGVTEEIRKANEERKLALALTPGDEERVRAGNRADDQEHDSQKSLEEFTREQQEKSRAEIERIRAVHEAERKTRDDMIGGLTNGGFFTTLGGVVSGVFTGEDPISSLHARANEAAKLRREQQTEDQISVQAIRAERDRTDKVVAEYAKGLKEKEKINQQTSAAEVLKKDVHNFLADGWKHVEDTVKSAGKKVEEFNKEMEKGKEIRLHDKFEQEKQDMAKAKELMEQMQTEQDKLNEKLTETNKLEKEGYLTMDQASKIRLDIAMDQKKLADEKSKKDHDKDYKPPEAEIRRSALDLPASQAGDIPTQQLETQKNIERWTKDTRDAVKDGLQIASSAGGLNS